MCAHNASGNGIGYQAILHHIYIVTNIQALRDNKKYVSEEGSLRSPITLQCLHSLNWTTGLDWTTGLSLELTFELFLLSMLKFVVVLLAKLNLGVLGK